MRFAASEYGEETWQHQSVADIEIDLHWNLINHPSLRRQASVELADLDWEPVGPQSPGRVRDASHSAGDRGHACRVQPSIRPLTAAMRYPRGGATIVCLSGFVRLAENGPANGNMRAALDVSLGTTAHWLADTSAAELRRRLVSRTIARGGWRLISQKMLLHSGGQGHRVRRRLLAKLPAAPPSNAARFCETPVGCDYGAAAGPVLTAAK